MHVERLQHLIKTMREVQSRDAAQGHSHLKMSTWIDTEKTEPFTGLPVIECNTVACAAGWEATTKYAQEQGLTLGKHGEIRYRGEHLWTNETALSLYFDLSDFVISSLFFGTSYAGRYYQDIEITPQNVIDRVTYLLEVGAETYIDIAREKEWNYRMLPGGDGKSEEDDEKEDA